MTAKKVLIVDDNKEFLEELKEVLALSGYEMVAVHDSREAVALAIQAKPDVILLDLKMPGKSGFQIANEINRCFELQNVPIIAMSAFFRDEYRVLMNMCGIKKCLRKPFNPLEVISEIEEALANKGSGSTGKEK